MDRNIKEGSVGITVLEHIALLFSARFLPIVSTIVIIELIFIAIFHTSWGWLVLIANLPLVILAWFARMVLLNDLEKHIENDVEKED